MTEFEATVLSDLEVLKSQMNQLIGVGQPGRLIQLEKRVDAHERSMQQVKGYFAAGGALLAIANLIIEHYVR
ncbi:MAG: hypothetical protein FWD64_07645 [Acidobacteriaceae bacterium]|nr:hypothetical protein [Acidobacteriaceae bacterium]